MGVKGVVDINDYEILQRANQFKNAADILKKSGGMAIPLEVNVCFACELYLKYLINFRKQNLQVARSDSLVLKSIHNLKELYNEIDDADKAAIKGRMSENYEERLEKVGLNFQEIRYEYEYEKVTFAPGFLLEFMNVLSEICNV